MADARTNLELRSTLRRNGDVELTLTEAPMPEPGDDGIVVEMLAAPIHPADMSLLFARADPGTAERVVRDGCAVTILRAGEAAANAQAARVGVSMPVGMEGAGRVVAVGPGVEGRAPLGRLVAVIDFTI